MTRTERKTAVLANPQFSKLGLTAKEIDVLATLIGELYAEPGFSDVDVETIWNSLNQEMSKGSIKGVIGSLAKKGIVIPGDDFDKHFHGIVYLDHKYYHLHPEWSTQA